MINNPQPQAGPSREDAQRLIEAARAHQLGTEYLQKGALDSVAATFKVHAFTVDHARDLLANSDS